jgi:hypothetical protein
MLHAKCFIMYRDPLTPTKERERSPPDAEELHPMYVPRYAS